MKCLPRGWLYYKLLDYLIPDDAVITFSDETEE